MSTNVNKEVKTDGVVRVKNRHNSALHLDRDPNDPRRNVPAQPNLSKLNEEDPEKEPEFQNPVKSDEPE